jgi:hypothetical protein
MVEYQRYRIFTIKLTDLQDAIQLQNIQHLHNGDICIAGNFTQGLTSLFQYVILMLIEDDVNTRQ